jgi:hypothetical protein
LSHAAQANSGNLNDFIHVPTHEFIEGRVRKEFQHHEDPLHVSNNEEVTNVTTETNGIVSHPPTITSEVDPQLVQAGKPKNQ